jgi:hypothetical protein
MFTPVGAGSQPVPLRSSQWSFYIGMTKTTGIWTNIGTPWDNIGQFLSETKEPEWNRISVPEMLPGP